MGTTYGDLFAANVRGARARADLRLRDVSDRMNRLGFPNWNDSKVSKVERGITPVPVAELYALAIALETTIGDLVGVNTPPMLIVAFPDPIYELTGVNVRNSAFNFNDGATEWDGDYLRIVRPANVTSTAAIDRSHQISQRIPGAFARTAGMVDEIIRQHPELARPAS